MRSSLRGQIVLITGAASGLGRRLATELAREGSIIAAIDLDYAGLRSLAAELNETRLAWRVVDVGDETALASAVKALESRLGPVDLLIANAGIAREMSALDFHIGDLEKQLRVNLLGVANSVAAVLPGMVQRRGGHLVAISSLLSYRGFAGGAGYCASKAGVNALMDSLRVELAPLGIVCTTVCPGWIRTPLVRELSSRKRGIITVECAAEHVLKAIRARRSFAAFPLVSRLFVALARWLPTRPADALARYGSRPRSSRRSLPASQGDTGRKAAA